MFKPYFNFRDKHDNCCLLSQVKAEGSMRKLESPFDPKYGIVLYMNNEIIPLHYDDVTLRDLVYEEIKKLKGIKE